MALTGRVLASIYGFNGSDISRAGLSGLTNSFPSNMVFFYPAAAGTTNNGVTINSVIQFLPSGTNQKGNTYQTDSTTAQLQTNGF